MDKRGLQGELTGLSPVYEMSMLLCLSGMKLRLFLSYFDTLTDIRSATLVSYKSVDYFVWRSEALALYVLLMLIEVIMRGGFLTGDDA